MKSLFSYFHLLIFCRTIYELVYNYDPTLLEETPIAMSDESDYHAFAMPCRNKFRENQAFAWRVHVIGMPDVEL